MQVWDLTISMRELVLDVAIICTLLLIGTVCRRYIRIFQSYFIPSNLIAGFLGLLLGPELLELIDFSVDRMGVYVYHLLALTFIGVGLRQTGTSTVGSVHIGFTKIFTFLLQALIGLLVALLFLWFISPDLVLAVGMLLPLGFGMGPGIAFSVGQSWEAFGFPGAANIGLTIAAIGFLVAYTTGVFIVNRGIRAGRTAIETNESSDDIRTGIVRRDPKEVGSRLTLFSGSIDTLTFHIALIGGIYLLTYIVTTGLAKLLVAAGQAQEVPILWSFNFVTANLLALGVRKLLKTVNVESIVDQGSINRLTGFFADVLVAAAIMGISLSIAWEYIGPIIVMSVVGAGVTYIAVRESIRRVFSDYSFERTVGLYAEQTGTISSGLALIRVTDPELVTRVAQDQVLGSGIALALGFPLLILINMPLVRFEGSPEGYMIVTGLLVSYLIILLGAWWLYARRQHEPVLEIAGHNQPPE